MMENVMSEKSGKVPWRNYIDSATVVLELEDELMTH